MFGFIYVGLNFRLGLNGAKRLLCWPASEFYSLKRIIKLIANIRSSLALSLP